MYKNIPFYSHITSEQRYDLVLFINTIDKADKLTQIKAIRL